MFVSRWENLFNLKYIMAICLLIGVFLLIWGGVEFTSKYQISSKCTSVTYGVVTDVEVIKGSTYRGLPKTAYIATVEPKDRSIFNKTALISGTTSYKYGKGDYVQIMYDPSDPSTYYIEHADPSVGGRNYLIAGGVLFLAGILIFVTNRKKD